MSPDAQTPTDRSISRIESRIRAYVKAHEREQIDFLEKAVNINSGTLNLAGVRAVGRLFEPEFAGRLKQSARIFFAIVSSNPINVCSDSSEAALQLEAWRHSDCDWRRLFDHQRSSAPGC